MNNIHATILKQVNLVLTSLISALGVIGCTQHKSVAKTQATNTNNQDNTTQLEQQVIQEQPIMCMYGVPRAQYILNGSVTDSLGNPLTNKQLLLKAGYELIHVQTNNNGSFSLTFDGFPLEQLSFEIDGQQYTQPVTYDSQPVDAFNRGTATIEVKIVCK